MQYLNTDQTAHDRLRIVFNDRVVFLSLDDHATMEDVAQAVRGFGVRRDGGLVAIDVTMGDRPTPFPSSHYQPADFSYEDDPAAECDCATSPGAMFTAPDRTSKLNT